MSYLRNRRRFVKGQNNLFSRKNNCRKSSNGRINQYIQLKDEDGKINGRTKLIRH